MKGSRLCKEQIIGILGPCEPGTPPTQTYRRFWEIERDVLGVAAKVRWPRHLPSGCRRIPPSFVCHFRGDRSPLRPARLVRTDGANVDGVLIAGNPAAGRQPGATSLPYPRLPDGARSIRSDRRRALRLSDVRLARRVPSQPLRVAALQNRPESSELRTRSKVRTAFASAVQRMSAFVCGRTAIAHQRMPCGCRLVTNCCNHELQWPYWDMQ